MSPSSRAPLIAASLSFTFSLGVYLWTLAPSVGFIDAGELAAVAHRFGIAHPTGYPLFTLVAGAWARLPIGDGIDRLNLLSALWSAAAAGVFTLLLWTLTGALASSDGEPRPPQSTSRRSAPEIGIDELSRLGASIFGALVIAWSGTFWSTALGVEVYSLHALMVGIVLLSCVRVLLRDRGQDGPSSDRVPGLWICALTLGLAFTNHMTTVYLVPALVLGYFVHYGIRAGAWRRLLGAVPFFAAGLLPYLYLPLRASAAPVLNWGDPGSWTRFVWHVSGKQYREWIFSSTEVAGKQLSLFVHRLPQEFAWAGLIVVPVGILWTLRRRPLIGGILIGLFTTCVAYSVNYDIHDIDSYFLLAHICCGIWAGCGLYRLLRAGRTWRGAAAASAAVILTAMLWWNGSRVSERGNHLVEDYTRNMFSSFADNALVLSFQWDYWVSASYYYQLVENLRPDVVVIDKELLRRSHYLTQVKRNFPSVCRGSESAFAAFEEHLYRFEHGLSYDPQRIEARYNALIDSIIDQNYGQRPIYLTLEIEAHLARGYQRVPEGLAFRLYRPQDLPSPDHAVWDDFSVRPFSRDSFLVKGISSAYPTMLTNRGIYLSSRLRHDRAGHYFDRALDLDPDFELAAAWKQRNSLARGSILAPPSTALPSQPAVQ